MVSERDAENDRRGEVAPARLSTPGRVLCYLRSALFYTGQLLLTLFFSVTGALLWWLPDQRRGRYITLGNRAVMHWLAISCGLRFQVIGAPPDNGPYVALAKHQSQWETFFLQWYLFPVSVVLKRELLNVPFFGWALRMMNAIAIDRGNPREAMRQTIEQGVQRLRQGYSVLIFPEGTRTPPGQPGRYARGGAGLAIKAGVPVVPIAHNAGEFWAPRGYLIRPGRVTVVIGEAIYPDPADSRLLTQRAGDWIEKQMRRISHTPYTGE
jgi:1-acyl-sn-glycerol-3-phosphate acyltransferase